ncbi:MAG: copper homeostasis protein CutC [Rhodobacteraceae bacterium]|nr:copper homeostasis protein CutC [Paracoccaceae bacterium]MCF8513327.1 copper homeostasis protein CutC [Paracoccaceae bacterium]MCF8517773.1 copper homeostasis protein CutC [Paracoccaceae bacterium]
MSVLVEVCVDTAEGLAEAVRGGAGRIELCSALDLGGLTPSVGMMRRAAGSGVPIYAMIRPRAGNFIWSPDEIAMMEADIAAAHEAGLQGVVLGASLPDGRLDTDMLGLLIKRAGGMGLTLHRCFDLVPDQSVALEQAVDLGVARILTSGGALSAPQGVDRLLALMEQAKGRIVIMPGGGLTPDTVGGLRHLDLAEVHSSCSVAVLTHDKAADFGFAPRLGRRTDAAQVRALRNALGPDRENGSGAR